MTADRNDDAGEEMEWQLVVPFVSNSPDWARGFEAGKLYQQMRAGEPEIRGCYQVLNDEQHFLTAQRLGYEARTLTTPEDGWVEMEFVRKEKTR